MYTSCCTVVYSIPDENITFAYYIASFKDPKRSLKDFAKVLIKLEQSEHLVHMFARIYMSQDI